MKTDVFRRLEEVESSPVRWSEDDIALAINEGLQELSDGAEFFEREYTIRLRKSANYYDLRTCIPDTILRVTAIWNPTRNTWTRPVEVRELDENTSRQWEEVDGSPHLHFVRGLWWLGIFPHTTADDETLRLKCKALHPDLEDDLDVPQQLPEEFHRAPVDYALYNLFSDDKEVTEAMNHWQKYGEKEAALKQRMETRTAKDRVSRMGQSR